MRRQLRFLLGDQPRLLEEVDPTLTVLAYLRRFERRRGTKEGCAEGDCGACTVVIGRLEGDRIRYRAANACILFLPMLDGCQLLTVEDLREPDGGLHPVQQAMVKHHASQCGFCTPGFVMSLYALYRQGERPDRHSIAEALAGNLCRCTGYGPIIEAALELGRAEHGPDRWQRAEGEIRDRLRAWRDDRTLAVGARGRMFFAPATLDALARLLLEHPDATVVSGATDVGLWVTKQHRVLGPVVWTGRVEELARIEEEGDHLHIGAAASYDAALAPLARLHPAMGRVLRRLGSVQIRNLGTVGGNIANGSPIGDTPPLLIAAGAELLLRRGDARRRLPLEAFFLAYGRQDRRPGEFVEGIRVPKPKPGAIFWAHKVSKRFDQDISSVCGAFQFEIRGGRVRDARIAFGGMAPVPRRATEAEGVLRGKPWDRTAIEAAMAALEKDFTPITDWRAGASYRMRVARNLLLKCWLESEGEPVPRLDLLGDLADVGA